MSTSTFHNPLQNYLLWYRLLFIILSSFENRSYRCLTYIQTHVADIITALVLSTSSFLPTAAPVLASLTSTSRSASLTLVTRLGWGLP